MSPRRTVEFFILLNKIADLYPKEQRGDVVEAFLRGWKAGYEVGKSCGNIGS